MNVEDRPVTRISPEFYMHLTFFVLALLVVVMSIAMTVKGTRFVYLPGAIFPMPDSCTSKMLFGIECPGCGMTRAFISISHGEFLRAWNFNPASFLAYLFVAGQLPWRLIQMRLLWNQRPSIESNWAYVLPILMATSMVIQWICRILL